MWILALTTGFFVSGLSGCGKSPCDDLEDLCPKCTDSVQKASCEATVAADDVPLVDGDDACQALLDSGTSSCK